MKIQNQKGYKQTNELHMLKNKRDALYLFN